MMIARGVKMDIGKIPPSDIEAEQAVIRKYAYR